MEFVLGSESSTDQHQPSSGSQLHSTVTFPSSIHSPPPFECKQTKKLNSFSSFCTVGCFMPRFEHGHEAKKKANPLHRQQSLLNAQFGKLKVTELSRWLIICASATQRDSASCRCFQRMLCYNWAPASRKEGFPPPQWLIWIEAIKTTLSYMMRGKVHIFVILSETRARVPVPFSDHRKSQPTSAQQFVGH